jgi:hypothetical protein
MLKKTLYFSILLLATAVLAQQEFENKSEQTIDLAFYAESKSSYATMEPGIERRKMIHEFRVHTSEIGSERLSGFLKTIAGDLSIVSYEEKQNIDPLIVKRSSTQSQHPDIEGVVFGKGMVRAMYWQKPRFLMLEIEAPENYCSFRLGQCVQVHFGLIEYSEHELSTVDAKEQNPNIEVRDNGELGKGVFAKEDIGKGEFIGGLYGQFFQAQESMDLPDEWRDHIMQCAPHLWRSCKTKDEAVQYLNHSCDPNVGVLGFFDFVAMRDIKAGEELTTDYAMQDDSNWVVPGGACLCGSEKCRGDIVPYRKLSDDEKHEIDQYVSHWILHKYRKCGCGVN